MEDHHLECDKMFASKQTCLLCGDGIDELMVLSHYQECSKAAKCDKCGLSYNGA